MVNRGFELLVQVGALTAPPEGATEIKRPDLGRADRRVGNQRDDGRDTVRR